MTDAQLLPGVLMFVTNTHVNGFIVERETQCTSLIDCFLLGVVYICSGHLMMSLKRQAQENLGE